MSKLRHVAIRCHDLEKSLHFYRDLLGFKVMGPAVKAYWMSDGEVNLTLLQYEGPPRVAPQHPFEFVHLGLIVKDLQATMARLQAEGYHVTMDDVKVGKEYDPNHPPVRSCKVHDPTGVILDIPQDPNEWPGVKVSF